jgi:hypothetical protein|tara:strand:- start:5042 stop:6259 length:1218 start_codon:yes stop_codon:yes gene_type:complete
MPKKQKQSKYYEQYFQIFTYFNNLWNKIIRKHVFKVKVENQPKVQDVKITNPQAPQSSLKVSNFEQVEQALNKNVIDIIKFLEKKMEELKVEPTDNSDILKSLKGIRKELKVKDLTPNVIKRLEDVKKAISKLDIKFDLSGLEERLDVSQGLLESLKNYTEYDEWKVKINGKQMEELVNAMGKQWISASGTGIIKDGSGNPYSSTNKLPVEATLEIGDIEIGAVELKDGDSDTRADIESDGTKNALFVQANNDSLGVQQVQSNSSNIATETTLGLIKDTDGIKKITDAVTVEQATAASLKALVNPNYLVLDNNQVTSVDDAQQTIFDASSAADAVFLIVANCGDDEIYIYNTTSVTSTLFFKRIASGESWEFPIGYTSDTANDLYAIRASAQGNNSVVVTWFKDN